MWGVSPILPSSSTMCLFHVATLHLLDPLGLFIVLLLPQNSVLLCLLDKEKRDEDFISGQTYATNSRLFIWIRCELRRNENVIIWKLNYSPLGKLGGQERPGSPGEVNLSFQMHHRCVLGRSEWVIKVAKMLDLLLGSLQGIQVT